MKAKGMYLFLYRTMESNTCITDTQDKLKTGGVKINYRKKFKAGIRISAREMLNRETRPGIL